MGCLALSVKCSLSLSAARRTAGSSRGSLSDTVGSAELVLRDLLKILVACI